MISADKQLKPPMLCRIEEARLNGMRHISWIKSGVLMHKEGMSKFRGE